MVGSLRFELRSLCSRTSWTAILDVFEWSRGSLWGLVSCVATITSCGLSLVCCFRHFGSVSAPVGSRTGHYASIMQHSASVDGASWRAIGRTFCHLVCSSVPTVLLVFFEVRILPTIWSVPLASPRPPQVASRGGCSYITMYVAPVLDVAFGSFSFCALCLVLCVSACLRLSINSSKFVVLVLS